ncbi:MAG: hypothetical protein ABS76_09130 [Pelagibacterium sp. SCN 64-44]|nr:MAG: hypothetical protein ABS76_09130 [Pelagibacterium sp. SCN 64-44]
MSLPLAISPAVMVNRKVHEAGAPPQASLAMVALLRQKLMLAEEAEAARATRIDPEAKPHPATTGAEVDRLI